MKILGLLVVIFSALGNSAPASVPVLPRYIVSYKAGTNITAHSAWVSGVLQSNLAQINAERHASAGVEKILDHIHAYFGTFDAVTLEQIKAHPDVSSVEQDTFVSIPEKRTSSSYGIRARDVQNDAPYGLDAISHRAGATGGHEYIYGSSAGTFSYVVDTGIYAAHQDFGGRVSYGAKFGDSPSSDDRNGHGTHVAGTIGGKTYGVDKKTSLISVKVLDDNGGGRTSDIISGINWVVNDVVNKNRANRAVMNIAIGGSFSQTVNNAVTSAYKSGMVVTVVAGNSNADAKDFSPASTPEAITVGAIQLGNSRTSSSNFGASLDVFAVGSNVLSTWIGSSTATNTISGTSMASAHVAGLASYLIATEGLASPAAVADRIKKLATAGIIGNAGSGSPNLLAYNGNGK